MASTYCRCQSEDPPVVDLWRVKLDGIIVNDFPEERHGGQVYAGVCTAGRGE